MQAIIRRPRAEQLSNVQLREWQRYRGWTVKILSELEHSGGMTTRDISDRTGCRCAMGKVLLQRMLKVGIVERVERWGWRITRDGLFLLSLNYVNSQLTDSEQTVNTKLTEEKSEPVPSCFRLATCHIKQVCKDKGYTKRNMALCHGTAQCIWGASGADRIPVETQVRGVST